MKTPKNKQIKVEYVAKVGLLSQIDLRQISDRITLKVDKELQVIRKIDESNK
ncbi:MAG: hypothetical protein R8N23_05435 [Reichenbachiella sp.]|uniref:hypothetical protein n=1 Tax=Reichenbachiella sp. TaxID=2184521 RepID=UPI00296716F3|nr:hypothetical protein [Reichenbachiella sp.]MDW3209286.1 hypothetical protein [Reichenbachiella sp.]